MNVNTIPKVQFGNKSVVLKMEKRKLFVSYSRADTEYVSKLVDSLRKVGFDVWFDANIRTGDEWDDVIEREIKNSDAMVLILSKSSVNSNNVKDEMSFAMQLNKGINPIKIEECDVPMRLARKQFTDFTKIEYKQGIHKLVDDIQYKLQDLEKEKPTSENNRIQDDNSSAGSKIPVKIPNKIGWKKKYILTSILLFNIFSILYFAYVGMIGNLSNYTYDYFFSICLISLFWSLLLIFLGFLVEKLFFRKAKNSLRKYGVALLILYNLLFFAVHIYEVMNVSNHTKRSRYAEGEFNAELFVFFLTALATSALILLVKKFIFSKK